MKRKTKINFLALMFIPCFLLLSACGADQLETKAEINTSGIYTASSPTTFSSYVENDVTEKTFSAYRLTVDVHNEFSGQLPTNNQIAANINLNAIYKIEQNNLQAAIELKSDNESLRVYADNGYAYVETNGTKLQLQGTYLDTMFDDYTTLTNFNALYELFENASLPNVSIQTNGNEKKFKIVAENSDVDVALTTIQVSDIEFYFNFNNNVLQGIKASYKLNASVGTINYVSSFDFTIAPFSGNINFPNFGEYSSII